MGEIRKLLAMMLIFLGLLVHTEGLKCYACNYWGASGDNQACTQSPPPDSLVDLCHTSQSNCEVFTTTENGKIYKDRKCAPANLVTIGCSQATMNHPVTLAPYIGERCVCNADKCNTAPKSKIQTGNICILIVVGGILKWIIS